MSNTSLVKLAEIRKPVHPFRLYVLTRWRFASTYMVLVILCLISSVILSALTTWEAFDLLVVESFIVPALGTLCVTGYLKRRWVQKSPLTMDDVYELTGYGTWLIRKYGKRISWPAICAAASNPEPKVPPTEHHAGAPRFDRDFPQEAVLGGILCALVREAGWDALPQEAVNAMYYYPSIYKPFYGRY
ncbi:hypothetical protein pEaSNUABM6_00214 [Erwinia phage pEa_SNUABM_6]|nr:hypothetical protein pEaSNUABM6_00214 [Erwinia phage pEa_SNUABM_6]